MTTLKELSFTDLLLTSDPKSCFFKGTPEKGQVLLVADPAHASSLSQLYQTLISAYQKIDFSKAMRLELDDIRYRCTPFNDALLGTVFFLRRQSEEVPCFSKIGISPFITDWLLSSDASKGFVLISGPQASGKTTTASSYVAGRLEKHGGHGVTFENPIELPLAGVYGDGGFCFQTEIDSESDLPAHVERSHRYSSPDIIFVGEIRTKYAASEVLRIALGSSRQLVVATIHGITATAAIERLLMLAAEIDGKTAFFNLSETLLATVHQSLEFNSETQQLELNVSDFLLLPFDSPRANQLRNKIKCSTDKKLFLEDNFTEQKNIARAKDPL